MQTRAPALAALALLAAPLPAVAQDQRAWSVSVPKKPEVTAYLSYGVPESDDLGLAMSCTVKTGQVKMMFGADQELAVRLRGDTWVDKVGRPAPWPVDVTVASGVQRIRVRGLANPDQMNGGSSVSVELSTRAPVIAAFAKTGVLHLESLGTKVDEPPAPKRHVAKFLGACK